MSCPAIGIHGQNLTFSIQAATTPTDDVTYDIYEDITAAPILSGTMTKDFNSKAGFCIKQIALTTANGFETFKTYTVRIVYVVAGATISYDYTFICLGAEAVAGSESTGLICTLADVKERLGLTDDHDDVITRIITSIEGIFNSYTQRTLIVTENDITEYHTPAGQYIQLERYPVVSITSIKQSIVYDFDNADALVADEGYRPMKAGKNGVIFFPYSLLDHPDSLQIVYRGGYCSAGQTPGDGEFAMPADLREAGILQASFLFKRRDDLGLSGVSAEGGSINKFSAVDLLPQVKKTLDFHRRPSL